MESARDSYPDPDRASGSARPPLPNPVWFFPGSANSPATRPEGLQPLSYANTKVSSLVPVSAGVPPPSRQPKRLARPRDALGCPLRQLAREG
jgi:hypothetical protein